MMGNLNVSARVSLMLLAYIDLFSFPKLCNKLLVFYFFKSSVINLNVVWTQNSHERIIFYLRRL